jgi:hypothetical protein
MSNRLLRLVHIAALLVGLGLGVSVGCFVAPKDDVLFSCEYDGDDRCPPEYQCEMDNCCHRIGSDVDASFGSCALGGNSAGTSTSSDTDTGTETDSTTEGESDSGTDSGSETESETETG